MGVFTKPVVKLLSKEADYFLILQCFFPSFYMKTAKQSKTKQTETETETKTKTIK